MDFGTERFLFGCLFAVNRSSGVQEFAIHDLASGHTYSASCPSRAGQLTVVAKLDFVANKLLLWVNPDLTLSEGSNTIAAERAYTGTFELDHRPAPCLQCRGDTQWTISPSPRLAVAQSLGTPRPSRMPSPCATQRGAARRP
ncbi:MAG: hypothetical protein IPK32_19380 [Verrucomicrobiaceae bacterium]|nr:hypothetical protein [Verrucomicrobiaceae bacterium]